MWVIQNCTHCYRSRFNIYSQINNIEVIEEGKTTTISSTMYDIVENFPPEKK